MTILRAPPKEITQLQKKLAEWKPKYNEKIELPAAKIYVALKEGKLGAKGILLPHVDRETALNASDLVRPSRHRNPARFLVRAGDFLGAKCRAQSPRALLPDSLRHRGGAVSLSSGLGRPGHRGALWLILRGRGLGRGRTCDQEAGYTTTAARSSTAIPVGERLS